MASPNRSLSDLRRKREQELAALNRVSQRGLALLDIDGTRAELWAILQELEDALKNLQESNWNYFDRITDDDFERGRAERYEVEATENCTVLQDQILSRLRDKQNDSRPKRRTALFEADSCTTYTSIKSEEDEDEAPQRCERTIRKQTNDPRRMRDDDASREDDQTGERTDENRPNPTILFRSSLPRLELEKFNGDISDWPRWYSLFKSLVDEQPLTNDEKMAHLQSAVTGLARHTIGGMLFDGNLYHAAMAALKDRFGRDEDVIHANLSRIFSAPTPMYLDPSSLEKFHGSVHCAVTVLQHMGFDGDLHSTENLRRAVQKLPSELKRDWGEHVIDIRKPSLIHFDSWLQRQVRIALNYATVSGPTVRRMPVVPESQGAPRNMRSTLTTEASAFTPNDCACCGTGAHQLEECSSFNRMDAAARSKFVFSDRRCFSCLKRGHLARYCKFRVDCGINGCRLNHHRTLHDEILEPDRENPEPRSVALVQENPQTLLQIVPVRVHGAEGRTRETLALLDPGSQTSLCADKLVSDLLIPGDETQLLLKHIGGTGLPKRSRRIKLILSPLAAENGQHIEVTEAFSVPQVNIRTPTVSATGQSHWKHLEGLPIPDCTKGKIELLLGANVIEAVLQREVRVGRAGQPVAIRTAFGWTLTGSVSDFVPGTMKEIMYIERASSEEQIDETVRKWETESSGTKVAAPESRSREDSLAQRLMEQTITKCGDRYQAGFLRRDQGVTMPNNKGMALSRLKSLAEGLIRQPAKSKAYQETVQNYVTKGHARKQTKSQLAINDQRWWNISHPALTNPSERSLRVVVDVEVEFTLNGRPLKYVSTDEPDPEALTPNHFLLRSSNSSGGLPPGVFGELDLAGSLCWRHSQALASHLWKRWRENYFPTLISRRTWLNDTPIVQPGDVVLLFYENAPRGHWPLANVVQVCPGSDRRLRLAGVKTASGTYRWSVLKLCLRPRHKQALNSSRSAAEQCSCRHTGGSVAARPQKERCYA